MQNLKGKIHKSQLDYKVLRKDDFSTKGRKGEWRVSSAALQLKASVEFEKNDPPCDEIADVERCP
jgi:hypothetical protein